jgi:hypothetical protein
MTITILRDEQLRARLEAGLDATAGETFEDDLWRAIDDCERRRARRIQLALTVLIAASVAAVTSAGVHALSGGGPVVHVKPHTIAASLECALPAGNGRPALTLTAVPRAGYATKHPSISTIRVSVGGPIGTPTPFIVGWWTGYAFSPAQFDPQHLCVHAAAVPLASTGLKLEGSYAQTRTLGGGVLAPGLDVRCLFAAHVRITAKVDVDSHNMPTAGQIAIRNARGRHAPIAFVSWSPRLVRAYTDPNSCFSN